MNADSNAMCYAALLAAAGKTHVSLLRARVLLHGRHGRLQTHRAQAKQDGKTYPLFAPVELATAELCLLPTLRLVAERLTRPVALLVALIVALLVLLLSTALSEVLRPRRSAIDEMEVALLRRSVPGEVDSRSPAAQSQQTTGEKQF